MTTIFMKGIIREISKKLPGTPSPYQLQTVFILKLQVCQQKQNIHN